MPAPLRKLALLMCISLCLAGRAFSVEFASPSAYAVGSSPQSVVVGDFNGDGKQDLAVLNTTSNTVSLLLGNGDGSFQTAKNFNCGNNPSSLAVGDFNGDGKLDLAVFMFGNSSSGVSAELRVLLGNGDGTFQGPVVTTMSSLTQAFLAGDFNGDKKTDIVTTTTDSASTPSLQLLSGNGDGTFQSPKPVAVSNLRSAHFAAGDFNKDGKLDLVVNVTGGLQFLQGQGDGTFVAASAVAPLALGTASNFWVTDINSDGNLDLVVDSRLFSCSGSVFFRFCVTSQNVGVLLGNGNGTFGTEQIFAKSSSIFNLGGLISPVLIGDFNGDGKLDVLYRQRVSGALSLQVRLGRADGTFATPISMSDPGALGAAQDFNSDKLSDLVTLDPTNGNVNILLNDSPSTGTDLAIIQSQASPEPVGVGTSLTYTADVMNEGPQDATGVTFTDTLPSNVTFVSANASAGTCSRASQMVTCTLGAVADTHDVQVTLVVTPNAVGPITNNMKLSGNESDGAASNNSASQTSTVVPVYTLTIAKSGTGTGTISADAGINATPNCGATCSATYLTGTMVNISAVPDSGSLLQSWGGACSGTPNSQLSCVVTMNANTTVSATLVLGITLNVSVTGGGTGTVTSNDGSISCGDTGGACSSLNLPGTQVSLTATPSTGSQFSSWSGACSGTNPNSCGVTLNSNQTVTATITLAPDFSVTPASTSLTVKRGSQVSEALTFPALGGFSAAIALTCSVSGPSPMPKCGVAPASVAPGASATLTVDTSNLSVAFVPQGLSHMSDFYAVTLPIGALALVLTVSASGKRRRNWLLFDFLIVALLAAACGGSSTPPPPPPQNFIITVSATSSALQHSTKINVTVN
jgi:uncharacterized repeat protein (TIGR01451 family)